MWENIETQLRPRHTWWDSRTSKHCFRTLVRWIPCTISHEVLSSSPPGGATITGSIDHAGIWADQFMNCGEDCRTADVLNTFVCRCSRRGWSTYCWLFNALNSPSVTPKSRLLGRNAYETTQWRWRDIEARSMFRKEKVQSSLFSYSWARLNENFFYLDTNSVHMHEQITTHDWYYDS